MGLDGRHVVAKGKRSHPLFIRAVSWTFSYIIEDFQKSRRSLRNLGVVQQIDVLGICHRRYIGPDRRRRQRLG